MHTSTSLFSFYRKVFDMNVLCWVECKSFKLNKSTWIYDIFGIINIHREKERECVKEISNNKSVDESK